MNILVCIKAIADTRQVVFDIRKKELKNKKWVVNPPDLAALEKAMEIKREHGANVIALSIANSEGDEILRKTLINGADRAIRIWDESLADSDTWSKSAVLGDMAKSLKTDLVICGNKSKDASNEVMGACLADRMKAPVVSGVCSLKLANAKSITVDKKLEKGQRETYQMALPAVITVDEGICEPKYVPLFGKAYNLGIEKKIETKAAPNGTDSARASSLVKQVGISQVKPRTKIGNKMSGLSPMEKMKVLRGETGKKKEMFTGAPNAAAKKIVEKLKELGCMK